MLAAPVPESYGDQFVSYLHAMLVYVSTGDLIGRLKQAPGYKKGQTEQQVKKAANDKKGTGYVVDYLRKHQGFDVAEEKKLWLKINDPNNYAQENRQRQQSSESNQVGKEKASTSALTKADSKAERETCLSLTRFTIEQWSAMQDQIELSDFIPPKGEVSFLAGAGGAGKTSLVMHWLAPLTQEGKTVLYLASDMKLAALKPYVLCYEINVKNFAVYSFCENHMPMINDSNLRTVIKKLAEDWGNPPDIIVMDSALDVFSNCVTIQDSRGNDIAFNPDIQIHIVEAWSKFIKPLMADFNPAVLGLGHPAKGRFGHDLPHSAKLQAYLHKAWMLYRRPPTSPGLGIELTTAYREEFDEDSSTRLLRTLKSRGGRDMADYFYSFEPVDSDDDTKTMTPIVDWREVEIEDNSLGGHGISFKKTPEPIEMLNNIRLFILKEKGSADNKLTRSKIVNNFGRGKTRKHYTRTLFEFSAEQGEKCNPDYPHNPVCFRRQTTLERGKPVERYWIDGTCEDKMYSATMT